MKPIIPAILLQAALVWLLPGLAQAGGYRGSYTTLYSFTGGADRAQPDAPLAIDSFHDLYGVANAGGLVCNSTPYGCGTVFKLNAQGQFSVLH